MRAHEVCHVVTEHHDFGSFSNEAFAVSFPSCAMQLRQHKPSAKVSSTVIYICVARHPVALPSRVAATATPPPLSHCQQTGASDSAFAAPATAARSAAPAGRRRRAAPGPVVPQCSRHRRHHGRRRSSRKTPTRLSSRARHRRGPTTLSTWNASPPGRTTTRAMWAKSHSLMQTRTYCSIYTSNPRSPWFPTSPRSPV